MLASPVETVVQSDYPLSLTEDLFATHLGYNPHEYRWGDGSAHILDFFLAADGEPYPPVYHQWATVGDCRGSPFDGPIWFAPDSASPSRPRRASRCMASIPKPWRSMPSTSWGGGFRSWFRKVTFRCRLAPGDYFISLGLASRQGFDVVPASPPRRLHPPASISRHQLSWPCQP